MFGLCMLLSFSKFRYELCSLSRLFYSMSAFPRTMAAQNIPTCNTAINTLAVVALPKTV